jgi:hypothetical protein
MRSQSAQLALLIGIAVSFASAALGAEEGLVGYWKLHGDCLDHSGNGLHGTSRDVDLSSGGFNGSSSFVEVPSSPALCFGTADFSLAAWVHTDQQVFDAPGDLVAKFDCHRRKGFHLTLNAGNPGYNSQSNVRHPFFGIDDAAAGQWTDCGRPGGKTHNSDALTVFEGDLYAGTTDGPAEADWAHVYRYRGGQTWEDCGRLGDGRTRGVYAMIVHDGALYAATSASHGRQPATMSFGRVYRYLRGQEWEDIGQPGENYRLNALASYGGKLYAAGFNIGLALGHCYVYAGDRQWQQCGEFAGWPHTLAVHDGRLHAAYPKGEVYSYDGSAWENLGNPYGSTKECSQIHALGVYRGELYAGTWPLGKVAVRRDGKWVDLGRLGDATEVVGLTAYNGTFYAGTIPRAEVFRSDGPAQWTSIRRLFDPPGFEPVPVGAGGPGVADWSRASSLGVYQGKLFVSTATCYRTALSSPLPDEIRGKVYSFTAGAGVSSDRDLGPGWRHLAAVRQARTLKLYVDGQLAAVSEIAEDLDVTNSAPLVIGFGPQSHFRGKLRHVRLYNRALGQQEIHSLHQVQKPAE